MTNLNWTIDEAGLAEAAQAQTVSILNDLQAQGYAIGRIAADSLHSLVAGQTTQPDADKLVVGVGTGFNAAAVLETTGGRVVMPSESGHATLPVRTEEDFSLCRFMDTAHGFPAVEEVLSGRGVEQIYDWLGQADGAPSSSAAKIMASVAAGDDPRAGKTAATFDRFLGAVVGDLALTFLPFGGIYLVGGVSRAFAPYLSDLKFSESLRDKGRFGDFVAEFPVWLIEDDYAALVGCAAHLSQFRKI